MFDQRRPGSDREAGMTSCSLLEVVAAAVECLISYVVVNSFTANDNTIPTRLQGLSSADYSIHSAADSFSTHGAI